MDPDEPQGLSVVIPTHGGRRSVLDTLAALLANDMKRLEVLVVSDGGSETTRKILASVDDPRFALIEKPKEGAAAARNAGLSAAQFEWVAFVDDDDVPRETWLDVWRDSAHGGTVAITAAMAHWRDGVFRKEKTIRLVPADPTMRASTLMAGCFWIRRDLLLEIGGYDEKLSASQNQDLGLRILDLAARRGIPDHKFVASDRVVIDVYAQEAVGRMQRYGNSYADSARVFMERYPRRVEADPSSKADYFRIISRAHRVQGDWGAARAAAIQACRAKPRDPRNYRSLALAVFPWMARLRGRGK